MFKSPVFLDEFELEWAWLRKEDELFEFIGKFRYLKTEDLPTVDWKLLCKFEIFKK